MEASIVDLRYKMKEVLQSLDRNETVKIYYHGKLKGIIQPVKTKQKNKSGHRRMPLNTKNFWQSKKIF